MELSIEEIRMLSELERKMDSGEQTYVRLDGGSERLAFSADLLEECGIVSGQSISSAILITLIKMNIANLCTKIALDKAAR